jgi:hypothetical protein
MIRPCRMPRLFSAASLRSVHRQRRGENDPSVNRCFCEILSTEAIGRGAGRGAMPC